MNTNTTCLSSLVFLIFFHAVNAQEPIDYNPWGKGIVTEEEANIIEKTHHFPITVEVTVVDESGIPLKGARCNVGIDSRLHMDGFNTFIGKTDENGKFTVNARGAGASEILVEMDGYYPSRPRFNIVSGKNNNIERIQKFGLEPCKGTASAMLKKVGKPIPMIVRWPNEMAQVDFPDHTKGEELRWDILKAEWLPPHGKGENGDLILSFNEDKGGVNIGNDGPQFYWHELNLKFANEHDGFFPIEELHGADSMLKFPRIAPEEGYAVKEMTIRTEFIEPRISYSGNKSKYGYLMRFRTEVDDDGKVVRGLYGKVTKPIEPGRSFNFHSYINPNWNDRNLEYDQTTNLAPELPERYKGVTWPP